MSDIVLPSEETIITFKACLTQAGMILVNLIDYS